MLTCISLSTSGECFTSASYIFALSYCELKAEIRNVGDMLDVDLYIIVEYGISISEVCKTIVETVRYKLESMTGVKVRKVGVSVEGIRI